MNKGFKIKRGFYSVFFVFFFVAVLVLANLIIENYDFKYDLTKEKYISQKILILNINHRKKFRFLKKNLRMAEKFLTAVLLLRQKINLK